jgi:membrane protein YqaA with SNARE-associated domain
LKETPVEQGRRQRSRGFYLISGLGFLLTVPLLVAAFYFWEEIQHVRSYGYIYGFLVSIMGGITVIPVPSLLVTFTLGRVLNPVYVGLVSGLGEALGGITIYLTGAGVGTIWSKLWSKERNDEGQPGRRYDIVRPVESQFWSKGESFYNRLVDWVGGRRGSWVVFIVSALVISPFYFAGLAAGTLRMGLLRFFLVSWAGKTIKGLTVAFAGYGGLYFLLKWMGG